MAQLFKNNAAGAIYGSISDADTTITLATGHGARFPSVGSDYFLATLIGVDGNGAENAWEIVKVTARSNDVLTVVRAQEGTTAAIWASGTRIEARATAATFGGFLVATGVTPGTYSKLTVLASGLISAGAQLASGDITTALGFTPENAANKNVANGYVGLDSNTLIPSVYLPSYVDDVIEVADFASLPGTGETGKIYVLATPYTSGGITSSQFRWSGSAYAAIVASPGTTDAVTEGASNLYFTTARARTSVSATGSLSYDNTTGVFSYTTPSNISTFTNDVGYITSTALNGYITAATVAATYLPLVGGSISGDVTFTGIGARIKGDFSNATVSSRAMLQTSTTNGTTYIGILPNGTGVNAQLHVFGASDPTNAPYGGLVIDASSVRLFSGALGSGTALPLTFYMGATEYARLSTAGNWLIGTATDNGYNKLQVSGTVSAIKYNGLTLTAASVGFTVAGGTTSKTITVSNTLTLAGTDGSTLNIGAGGTLGTGAYATIANYAPLAGATFTGDIGFSGAGRRITADFSNATLTDRLMFQSSTVNGNTQVAFIPNGTATNTQLQVYGLSDPTNAPFGALIINASTVTLQSTATGSGTALPLTFNMVSTEVARLSTGGNFLIGTTTDNATDKLQVNGSAIVTGLTVGTLAGLIKGTAGALSAATAGTDYVAPGGNLGTPSAGALTNCTADGTNSVAPKNIPQNSKSAAYTLVLGDAGKHILHPSADTTARTFTIPANSSVAYPIGTAITFINQNSAGVVTIAITTDTMRLAGAGTTGSRTLAANGVATAVKVTSTEWIISGTGLT